MMPACFSLCCCGWRAFWKCLATELVRHPRKLSPAITLAIHGFHYRMVAERL